MNGQKLYSCIVLSGGMSRRMGQDKGSMIIQEKPMILHILERLNYKINDAVIVLNDAQRIADYQSLLSQYCEGKIEDNFDYSVDFVEDEVKGKGPISGIMTGLKNIKTDYALVLPCDSPFISEDNIDAMFKLLEENLESDIDAIIPFHIKSNKDKYKDTVVVRVVYKWDSFDHGNTLLQAGVEATCEIISVNQENGSGNYTANIKPEELDGPKIISTLTISSPYLQKPKKYQVTYEIKPD